MYSIVTTKGLIIESKPLGESGKLLSVFTRDLGLILASAQGIRLEKSKLRFHSQEYTFGEFSFVRGREFWRLTNAGEAQEAGRKEKGERRKNNRESQEIIGRIVLLLRRLLRGEEPHPELFDHIETSFNFLENSHDLSDEQLKTTESLIVFRMLHLLGYIGTDKKLEPKIFSNELTLQQIDQISLQRTIVNSHINKALRESHL